MEAHRYPDGSITFPGHPIGPGGEPPVETVDLTYPESDEKPERDSSYDGVRERHRGS